MKKVLLLILCLILRSVSFAYSPNTQDQETINKLTQSLNKIINNDPKTLRNFYTQLTDLQPLFSGNDKLTYMLSSIASNLHTNLQEMKKPALVQSQLYKQDFVKMYQSGIIKDHQIPQKCRDRRQLLDDMSFVYNLPTAITMATRYAESTCGFYLPIHPTYGSNGPFQIISKDYGTGEMTEQLFRQTLQDFLEFSHHKYNMYAKANSKSGLIVNLSYSTIDYTGVVRHGSLYNGLSGRTIMGDIQPMKRWYIFNNYESAYSGAVRHGLMPMFIKSLERELNNFYPKIFGTGQID